MKKRPALNAWADINSLLRTHKLINAGLILICTLQILIIGLMYFSDPIVIVQSERSQEYLSGERFAIPISEKAVERFVSDFLKKRYQWKTLKPESIRKSLTPIVTEGLNKRLFGLLTHLNEKEFQGKKTSQAIVNIDVSVTDQKVVASFDKLLRIEGIPIPIPTTVSLNIIKGAANAWNPIGLYINGIKEHQSK